jgi:hypothetical protein
MAQPKGRPPAPPPLVAWPTGKLVVFAALLPLAGAAILGLVIASLAIRAAADAGSVWYERAGEVWRADDLARSVLVTGWLAAVGLGLLGFAWVVLAELRRRRRHPSAEEQAARRAAAEEGAREGLETTRSSYRAGWWFFLIGAPGLGVCVWYKWLGGGPPQWATFLALPLVALAPLCWMRAINLGVWLWAQQGRPSRWLGYASLTFGVFFAAVFVVALSYLRT